MADSIQNANAQQIREPLTQYVAPFVQWAREQGYAEDAIRQRARIAAGFARWIETRQLLSPSANGAQWSTYLRYHARNNKPYTGDARALSQFRDFLLSRSALANDERTPSRPSPVEQCIFEFKRYLIKDRVLAQATVHYYAGFIDKFLKHRFGTGPVALSNLSIDDVIRFVRREASRIDKKRAKVMTTALRSFLRYACFLGKVAPAMAAAVPMVANWSRPMIPRGIGPDQVRRVLENVDRSTATGRRDYAILLLLARLGLRAGEIVFLELQDVDWQAGSLAVRGKGGRRTKMPLPKDVGDAIVDYLRHGRARTSIRRLFLCAEGQTRALSGPATLGSIVERALNVAGATGPTKGAHQFRHGLATEMLRRGASLREIGELLGHRRPETTMIYAKVDIEALRTLALPWPGKLQ
jgi:integrase/recombinase XerD